LSSKKRRISDSAKVAVHPEVSMHFNKNLYQYGTGWNLLSLPYFRGGICFRTGKTKSMRVGWIVALSDLILRAFSIATSTFVRIEKTPMYQSTGPSGVTV
jgi:hypothetical protein